MIKKKEIMQNIFHLEADTQYELTSLFLRPEEFYESSFKEIRGRVFSLEFFMDRYAKEFGNFTYTSDWNGFNIPDYSIREFFNLFQDSLLEKEKYLYKLLNKQLMSSWTKFYVIGTHKQSGIRTLDHEIAHALYYLSDDYKKEVNELIKSLPEKKYKKLSKIMKGFGYGDNVINDEINAHLSTSSLKELDEDLGMSFIPIPKVCEFRKLFKKAKRLSK